MTILISLFFFNFRKKRKLDFINFFFSFFSISIPFDSPHSHPYFPHSHPHSPHSHPDSSHFPHSQHSHPHSPHSHPDSLHSHLDSPRSQPDYPRSQPDSPHSHHSPHSVPRFLIPAFTDSLKAI